MTRAATEAVARLKACVASVEGVYGFDDDKAVDTRHFGPENGGYNDFAPLTWGDLRGVAEALSAPPMAPDQLSRNLGELNPDSPPMGEAGADFEAFLAEAISSSPRALQDLGKFLADVLDEDHWKTADRYLLALAQPGADGAGEAAIEIAKRVTRQLAGDYGPDADKTNGARIVLAALICSPLISTPAVREKNDTP